ncbi:cation transporter [Pseudoxanthomonas broegbernensis]|uniref:Cation transporter n=2 Tax=Pseudoxanthomonas broegbernensis TaxID=83619 RepID=A0A7V8GM29_9GAMM|nr:cation transporter [Pseudoxanthomonas broegbernensis]KAF1686099.1 cation transporter [Pseudoxanthomonas broegbernensis]MBB6063793.1 Co/Zn/Cd efflux system component [Pseudoxanthomonas broegbernensis]
MAGCCGCEVEVRLLQARQRRVLAWVLAINAAAFAGMVAAALHAGSSALLSGALDNLGDALTYALSLAVVGASLRAKAWVAMFKAALILGAAAAVCGSIAWRLLVDPAVPLFGTMGWAGGLNLAANLLCLWLLRPYRDGDVNLASAYECARNDIADGVAVLAAGAAVWWTGAGWPDLLVAALLLAVFLRSAWRVFLAARRALAEAGRAAPRPG